MGQCKYLKTIILILLLAVAPLFTADNKTDSGSGSSVSNKDPFSQTKFLPGISFILDFTYVRRNLENAGFESLEVPGFFGGSIHSHGDEHGHASPNAVNGFNFNYGELVLFAAVDPYFDLFTSFHLSAESFEIEEAYITSRRLPLGFGLKVGKFLSSFGRLNAQHAHIWDFAEIPLVLRAFFGEEGMSEKGIRLNWVASTDFYLSLGVETLQGANESSFGTERFDIIDAGTGEQSEVEEPPLPNLWTFFGKTSLEAGELVVLAGVSYALGKSRLNLFDSEDEQQAFGFNGDTRIFGIDVYAKYIIDSYRYLSFQFEYMNRDMEGTRYDLQNEEQGEEAHDHEAFEVEANPFAKKQAGLYAQLIFRFHRSWRMGVRWDALNKNDVRLAGDSLGYPGDLNRYSFMIDHNPTEFSRVRFQYNINRYGYLDGVPKHFNQFVLQFNMAIGAHGAHPF
jgi:hypothetical protein